MHRDIHALYLLKLGQQLTISYLPFSTFTGISMTCIELSCRHKPLQVNIRPQRLA